MTLCFDKMKDANFLEGYYDVDDENTSDIPIDMCEVVRVFKSFVEHWLIDPNFDIHQDEEHGEYSFLWLHLEACARKAPPNGKLVVDNTMTIEEIMNYVDENDVITSVFDILCDAMI